MAMNSIWQWVRKRTSVELLRELEKAQTHLTAPKHTHSIAFISTGKGVAGTEMGIDGLKPTHIVAGRKGV